MDNEALIVKGYLGILVESFGLGWSPDLSGICFMFLIDFLTHIFPTKVRYVLLFWNEVALDQSLQLQAHLVF
jgi:hypothetical protein